MQRYLNAIPEQLRLTLSTCNSNAIAASDAEEVNHRILLHHYVRSHYPVSKYGRPGVEIVAVPVGVKETISLLLPTFGLSFNINASAECQSPGIYLVNLDINLPINKQQKDSGNTEPYEMQLFKPIKVWLVCAEAVADQVDIYLSSDNDIKADKDEIEQNKLEKEANMDRNNRGRDRPQNNNNNNHQNRHKRTPEERANRRNHRGEK